MLDVFKIQLVKENASGMLRVERVTNPIFPIQAMDKQAMEEEMAQELMQVDSEAVRIVDVQAYAKYHGLPPIVDETDTALNAMEMGCEDKATEHKMFQVDDTPSPSHCIQILMESLVGHAETESWKRRRQIS